MVMVTQEAHTFNYVSTIFCGKFRHIQKTIVNPINPVARLRTKTRFPFYNAWKLNDSPFGGHLNEVVEVNGRICEKQILSAQNKEV